MSSVNAIEILLVEDNPGDARLTQEALKDSKLYNILHVVEDGVEALSFLRREPPYENMTRPDMILLDLNLPRMSGREVLEIIKNDQNLKTIPIVVLTTSDDERDILASYTLHANCYITKPVNIDQFAAIVKNIHEFWFTIVKLPPKSS
ncbi:MAG: response regulator [Anaerolineae bacterium]|nr:response regulator [Anaerolineae bacterium]